MLEIVIEPRKSYTLKQAVMDAIKTGDYNSLYDDIRDSFTDDQIEEIEELLESGDVGETIDEIVNEWNGEDVDELFETIASYFAESSIELHFIHDEEFEEEEADEDFDYDDLGDTDEEEPEEEEDAEEEFLDPEEDL